MAIARGEVPVRVPEPVPAVHHAQTGVRAVPEVRVALRKPDGVSQGSTPLPLRGIHPQQRYNQSQEAKSQDAAPSQSQQVTTHKPAYEPLPRAAFIRYSRVPLFLPPE